MATRKRPSNNLPRIIVDGKARVIYDHALPVYKYVPPDYMEEAPPPTLRLTLENEVLLVSFHVYAKGVRSDQQGEVPFRQLPISLGPRPPGRAPNPHAHLFERHDPDDVDISFSNLQWIRGRLTSRPIYATYETIRCDSESLTPEFLCKVQTLPHTAADRAAVSAGTKPGRKGVGGRPLTDAADGRREEAIRIAAMQHREGDKWPAATAEAIRRTRTNLAPDTLRKLAADDIKRANRRSLG